MKTLQKFAAVHATIHNLFNQELHIVDRQGCKERRSEALSEWRSVTPHLRHSRNEPIR
jgi:putative transposase